MSKSVALITPSYHGDFERCRLLCDSVDRFVDGAAMHYILVDNDDFEMFKPLIGSKREVINENDLLPNWLFSFRAGFGAGARKMWASTKTWPMRGWHVQLLRRISIAHHVEHDGLLYCDSDMLFVRDFHAPYIWRGEDLRLYRKPEGINKGLPGGGNLHFDWTRSAARLNGLHAPIFPAHDYINNLVSWRREHVVDMCALIEKTTSRDWVSAIGRNRSFSECQIYGAYADGVKNGAGHWHAASGLCETYWSGEALSRSGVEDFVDNMQSHQVAVGIQSFTQTPIDVLRPLLDR